MTDTMQAEAPTLDEFATLLADEPDTGTDVAVYDDPSLPDPDIQDEGTLDDAPASDGRSLTLDQASAIDLYDDEAEQADGVPAFSEQHRPVVDVDGKLLSMHELVNGYVANRDHEVVRSRLENEAHAVRQAAQAVVDSAWHLADFLAKNLPPVPPANLAMVDPASYTALKADHEAAYDGVRFILDRARQTQAVVEQFSEGRHGDLIQNENIKLVEHFPEAGYPEGREKFFDSIRDVAYACDFTEDELRRVVDHRLFRLAHLAVIGKQAKQERSKPRRKKHRRQQHGSALARLAQTGSIDDALAVNF